MTRPEEGRRTPPGARSGRAGWKGVRGAAFALLVATQLMPSLALASVAAGDGGRVEQAGQPTHAADQQGAPGSSNAADPRHRVSPYARIAREHQQLVGRKSGRVQPTMRSTGHASRVGGRTHR